MPTESRRDVSLLGHCPDPRCRGSAQRAIAGVAVLLEWTYKERSGGQGPPGVETSVTQLHAKNPEDAKCGHCSRDLEISDQPRPKYENSSGHPQNGLLHVEKWNPAKTGEVEALVDRLAEKLRG